MVLTKIFLFDCHLCNNSIDVMLRNNQRFQWINQEEKIERKRNSVRCHIDFYVFACVSYQMIGNFIQFFTIVCALLHSI